MESINQTFLLSLAIIALGYGSKKAGILTEDQGKGASRLIINITLPAIILKTIPRVDIDVSLALLPFLCWGVTALTFLGASFLFKNEQGGDRGMAFLSSLGFNIGLFAFPLVEALFGDEGIKTAAMFDLGNAFIVFGFSYFLAGYYAPGREKQRMKPKEILLLFLKSVPFMCYILGLTINLTGLTLPRPVLDLLDILAGANKALVLLVMGIMLNFSFDKKHWKLILKLLGLRYVMGLLSGILVLLFFPFSQVYKSVIFICLILPIPLAVIPFSVEFSYDPRVPGTVLNLMTIISFFLMWGFLLLYRG